MKIFPNGLEINENEALVLKEEIDDLELWVIQQITNRLQMSQQAFKHKWLKHLENDDAVQSYPKKIEDLISLIISRPYFKSKEDQRKEEKMRHESTFTVQ